MASFDRHTQPTFPTISSTICGKAYLGIVIVVIRYCVGSGFFYDNHHAPNSTYQTAPYTNYDPNRLLDILMARLGLRSEKALSQYLRMSQKTLGNIRSGDLELSVPILLWKAECTSTSVEELRSIVGDRRRMLRLSFTMAA